MKKKMYFQAVLLVVIMVLSACSTNEESDNDIGAMQQHEENVEQQTQILPESENQEMSDPMVQDSNVLQVFTPEDVKIVPEIVEYDFESACEKGEIQRIQGRLPGAAEGTWFLITVDDVEFFYGRYDDIPDKAELFGYAIKSSDYSLDNGFSVGMTKSEIIESYPAMAVVDKEGNILNDVTRCAGWNNVAYPRSPFGMDTEWDYVDNEDYYWDNQFDYMILADVEQQQDAMPKYIALMMKDDVVAAITFYYPTAG